MTKTAPEKLAAEISPDLITYLGDGTLNSIQLTRSIDYAGLDIEEFDQLKQLHFVLYSDVVEYIERLPERLRRIKTTHKRQSDAFRGEVRGQINWPQTLQHRARIGYNDRTLFVVDNPAIEVDISENRVVKKLLAAINEPLKEDLESIDQDWRAAWDDTDIVRLQRTLAQNVYLDALPKPAEIELTDRDLTTARRARQPLYYEAAELYRLYEDFLNDRFYSEDVQTLLRETLVTPTQNHKIFELYCLFAFIRALRSQYPDLQLRRIQSGADEIAVLDGPDEHIAIYYDESGPLSFFERYPTETELETEYDVPEMVKRQAAVLEEHERLVQDFLSRGSDHTFYAGRPDFIALRWVKDGQTEALQEIVIGEVKYTQSQSTFSTGLRELLEYIRFAKEKSEYLYDRGLHIDNIYGVLCTDGVETNLDQMGHIQHWDTDRLQQFF